MVYVGREQTKRCSYVKVAGGVDASSLGGIQGQVRGR